MKKESGFTIIEMLIAIALIGILLGPIAMLYKTGFSVFYSQWARSGIKGETGRALAGFGSDLRQASAISVAGQSNLSFTGDLNGDGVMENITYAWSGATNTPLNRIVVSSSVLTIPVVNSVSGFNFTYYDANDNALVFPVNLSLARIVGLNITAVDKDESLFLIYKARLRNL